MVFELVTFLKIVAIGVDFVEGDAGLENINE